MKTLSLFVFVLLAGLKAQATPTYYNMFLPQALTNLGVTFQPLTSGCFTCHGTATAFGNFNATFGAAVSAQITGLGFAVAADGVPNLTQGQIDMIVQNLLDVDSDGDTLLNRAEFMAGSNVAVANAVGGGGGTTGGPCDDDPTLPMCTGDGGGDENSSSSSGAQPIVWNDQAYQLNPGCAAEETVQRETKSINTAGGAPIGVAALLLLPLFVSFIRRRQ